jgi:hypothetical protein
VIPLVSDFLKEFGAPAIWSMDADFQARPLSAVGLETLLFDETAFVLRRMQGIAFRIDFRWAWSTSTANRLSAQAVRNVG